MYYLTHYPSPLGCIGLACSDEALVALWLPGQQPFEKEAEQLSSPEEHSILAQTAQWLDRYFAGEGPEAEELPLTPEGTLFRRLIWELLLAVPYGQITTYGTLAALAAERMGKAKMSAQAVGGAVGANPISIVIPCHRCLGTERSLTGYAGGLHLKKYLLELEKIPYRD